MRRALACIALLLLAQAASPGDFFRENPLLDMAVVQFEPKACTYGDPPQPAPSAYEWKSGAEMPWTVIPFQAQLEGGYHGIAWERGVAVAIRQCCLCPDGEVCTHDGEPVERVCEEMIVAPIAHPWEKVYSVGGGEYQVDHVIGLNAKAIATPESTPTPIVTPAPTAPPTPTMLPYLGACCFDLAQPWVCGVATEPVCQSEGGVRWVRQTPCSNEVCS